MALTDDGSHLRELRALVERIDALEQRDARAQLDELRRRLDSVEHGRSQQREHPRAVPTKPAINVGPMLLSLVGGAATLMVPLTAWVHGNLAAKREAMVAEHDIVSAHLGDALNAEVDDLDHLRHLRFLRSLRSERKSRFGGEADEPPSDLTLLEKFGDWADQEYKQYFIYITAAAPKLAERINETRVRVALQEARLEQDRGWVEQTKFRWTLDDHTYEEFEELLSEAEEILIKRQGAVDDLYAELGPLEKQWLDIAAAYELDGTRAHELVARVSAPVTYLASHCRGEVTDRCIELGELQYGEALRAQAGGSPDVNAAFEAANAALQRGCTDGQMYACALLSRSYRLGTGVAKDINRAAKLLETACDGHDPQGCNGLGMRYLKGDGREADAEKARALFQASCDQGWLNGCDSLGHWYATNQQYDKAKAVFADACVRNEIRACVNLANLELDKDKQTDDYANPSVAIPSSPEASESDAAAAAP